MKKIKIFEAFAGIGAQSAALKKLNLKYEVVGISEWFINALLAYDAIHHHNEPFECPYSILEQREILSRYRFSKVLINKLFEEDICTLRAETFAN